MKDKVKRVVAVLLVVCISFSFLTIQTFAADIYNGGVSMSTPTYWNANGSNIASSHPVDSFNLDMYFTPSSSSSSEKIPAESYFDIVAKPVFGVVSNMTIADWVLSSTFSFANFSSQPVPSRVIVFGVHDGSSDILSDGSASSDSHYSGFTTRDYESFLVRFTFQGFLTDVSNNSVSDDDLVLITCMSSTFRYSSDPLPSDETVSYVNSQISLLSAQFDAHIDEVSSSLYNIERYLLDVKLDSYSIKNFISQICSELNGFGTDVDAAIGYLQVIAQNTATTVTALNTVQSYLSDGNTVLSNILTSCLSLSSDVAASLEYLQNLCSSVDQIIEQGASVTEYLDSIDSRFEFLNTKITSIEDLVGDGNDSLRETVSYLNSVDASCSLASGYLLNISLNVSDLKDNTASIIELIESSNSTIKSIYTVLNGIFAKLGPQQQSYLATILTNLISQGTQLKSILSLLTTIDEAASTTADNSQLLVTNLEELLTELQELETAHADTNERLDHIAELIEDFEVNIQKSVDKVYSSSDKKGLGGILASIVSKLSSVINFVGDVFGNMLTSIPDMIGGFNDSLEFWDTAERYEYRPYQISIYTKDTADYTNSNSAVQALFAEAEKYLGYPYVWGGASPETSFDCSGYVSYVLNASGVYPVSRLTAQGLYNICTPIDSSEAMPGDLIFFTGTYNTTDTVTHVGFYAGDGRMLHCGDPIQYIDWENSHYKSHFYSFGRLPYNDTVNRSFVTDLEPYYYLNEEDPESSSFNLSVQFSDEDCMLQWFYSANGSNWDQLSAFDNLSSVSSSALFLYIDYMTCFDGSPARIKCVAIDNLGNEYDSSVAAIVYDGWEG